MHLGLSLFLTLPLFLVVHFLPLRLSRSLPGRMSCFLFAHYENMDHPTEFILLLNSRLLDPKASRRTALAEPTGPQGWKQLEREREMK